MRAQLVDKALQALFAAEFGVHARVVDGVVAVRGTARGGRDRRQIRVADSERRHVVDLARGVVEGEILVKLEAKRGARDGHGVRSVGDALSAASCAAAFVWPDFCRA